MVLPAPWATAPPESPIAPPSYLQVLHIDRGEASEGGLAHAVDRRGSGSGLRTPTFGSTLAEDVLRGLGGLGVAALDGVAAPRLDGARGHVRRLGRVDVGHLGHLVLCRLIGHRSASSLLFAQDALWAEDHQQHQRRRRRAASSRTAPACCVLPYEPGATSRPSAHPRRQDPHHDGIQEHGPEHGAEHGRRASEQDAVQQ